MTYGEFCGAIIKSNNETIIENNKSEIILPLIQRDFVWKYDQIEDLWDSILNDIPFPPLALEIKDGDDKKQYLIDGQQRASVLFIPYFWAFQKNPKNDNLPKNHNLHIKPEWYRIFVDLGKPFTFETEKNESDQNNDHSKNVYVITIGNPWGFTKEKDSRKVSEEDRRKWKQIITDYNYPEKETWWNETKYSDLKEFFFPYNKNVVFPIPIDLVLKYIKNNKDNNGNKDMFCYWSSKEKKKWESDAVEFFEKINGKNKTKVQFEEVNKRLTALIDKIRLIYNTDECKEDDNKENNDKQLDFIQRFYYKVKDNHKEEAIFNRLNNNGTSMNNNDTFLFKIKSYIFRNVKRENSKEWQKKVSKIIDNIHSVADDFFLDQRYFMIICAIRYGKSNKSASKPNMYSKKELKKFLRGEDEYEELISIFNEDEIKDIEIHKTLSKIYEALKFDPENNEFGLPRIMLKKIFEKCVPCLLNLIIHWEWFEKVKKEHLITFCLWYYYFGFNTKARNEYYHVSAAINDVLWTNSEKSPHEFANVSIKWLLGKIFEKKDNKYNKIKTEVDKLSFENEDSDKINNKTPLEIYLDDKFSLIYAQRNYIEKLYPKNKNNKDIYFLLDDINCPFDSDHIFPHAWVDKFEFADTDDDKIIKTTYEWKIANRRMIDFIENRSTGKENPIYLFDVSSKLKNFTGYKMSHNLVSGDYEYKKSFVDKDDFLAIYTDMEKHVKENNQIPSKDKLKTFFAERQKKIYNLFFDQWKEMWNEKD